MAIDKRIDDSDLGLDSWGRPGGQKLDTQELGSNGQILLEVNGDTVTLPDASFLIEGSYRFSGSDLFITNPDGELVVVRGYLNGEEPPLLQLSSGVMLRPETVATLAEPEPVDVVVAGPILAPGNGASIGHVENLAGPVTARGSNGETRTVGKSPLQKVWQNAM
jgi:hypothetical protein